ncbi:MAG: ABC transporter ATP-binding protein [Ruminococcaceae bacterium]|nr:ABC transporter ATP-binding protein [Oscillospiraceae bacterium]
MKKLLRYMKGYGKECVLGPLLKLAEATLELLVPYVIMKVVNVGIEQGDQAYIIRHTLLLVLMGFAGLVFSVSAQYFCAKAAVGFSSRIREVLFSHVQSLSYREIDSLGRSTLMTRLTSDVNQVQTGINLALRLFLRSPFIVFGAMILAFTIDVDAAVVFVVTIPVLSAVIFAIMLISIPLSKKVQSRLDAILSKTRENLSGVRMLRALCKEKSESEEFDQKNRELSRSQKFVGRITSLMNPLTFVIINVAIVILMQQGAVKVEHGVLTQGAVLALYNYMSQILVELVKLANLIINITKAVACGKRVESVLETSSSLSVSEEKELGDVASAVEFKNVVFRYGRGGAPALSDISFFARPGETIGLIGGTGSGKSTLVNLLCRFYDPESGVIYIDGQNVKSYDPEVLNHKIGIVPQKATLFRGTIASNLRFGKQDATEEDMMSALRDAQALSILEQKEDGLNAVVEQGGRNFSGGQRQRLTIARALIRKPSILIFDDSSSALDYATDLALRRALSALPYRPTIFLISQRAATLRHADRILVLDEGVLVGCGTHDDLYKTCDVYHEICQSQSKKA